MLAAVEDVVAEPGVGGLSLREVARRAVCRTARHHFGGKTGLLTVFAARGFVALDERLAKAAAAALGSQPCSR